MNAEKNILHKEFEKNLNSYFNDVIFQAKIYKEYQEKLAEQTSFEFNVFNYISLDENQISQIITDILQPIGKHGQKNIFLTNFLNILKISIPSKNIPTIKTEVVTSNHIHNLRRMDILIDWGDFGVMIENKPYADDGENQLNDYAENLENRYGKDNFVMIYLSHENKIPSENSILKELREELESKKQFFHITYQKEFKQWIEQCILICQSQKYKYFLTDFLNKILNIL